MTHDQTPVHFDLAAAGAAFRKHQLALIEQGAADPRADPDLIAAHRLFAEATVQFMLAIAAGARPSRESVLDAFAIESEPDRPTLERYLRLYPEYAGELIDLSRELRREACDDAAPLSTADQALIDAAWSRHAASSPAAAADPLAALTVDDWRAVARGLFLLRGDEPRLAEIARLQQAQRELAAQIRVLTSTPVTIRRG